MDKKIYSKITKERKEEFQIETSIYQTQSGKKVVKSPLTSAAEEHIKEIHDHYLYYINHGKDLLIDSYLDNEHIVFEFIKGESYCCRLLSFVNGRDKEGFIKELRGYRSFVDSTLLEEKGFSHSEEFIRMFGRYSQLEGKASGEYLNVDMSFDNIIFNTENRPKVIDYEWILKFPIPVDFVVFRAINAFWIKNNKQLAKFVTLSEIFEIMNIPYADYEIYNKMDSSFVAYVNGKGNDYKSILTRYQQEVFYVDDLLRETDVFAQIFIDLGSGFSETNSVKVSIKQGKKTMVIDVDLTGYDSIKAIRIDPVNTASIIKYRSIQLFDEQDESIEFVRPDQNKLIHNASIVEEGMHYYTNDDPQLIVGGIAHKKYTHLLIDYELVLNGKTNYKKLVEILGDKLVQAQEKNKYIENTTAYRLLLKKKVDNNISK